MSAAGFVSVRDGRIVDAAGEPLLLRGMGLGNWLLPEGYMWKLSPGRESARELEALVEELIGPERASAFWVAFRDAFVARGDIERIAADGMDHVRLPINWRIVMEPNGTIRPDGFDRIDDLVGWCRDAGLRVLLDLHGAPGGQTGTNIDDSAGRPELFMDDRNADLTEQLWVALARRYRDEPAVLGYDLLNEPLPHEWQHRYADELVALYRRLTAAIRAVDDRHLLMYEGSHWATNWSMFTEVWDDNSVLQFHKYWSPPDRPSIQRFVDVGERLGLPIYMGEGGENNTDWLATVTQLYEDLGIGWCFWPWKKIDTITSPCSITPPPGWDAIVAYANGAGPRPSPDGAARTLDRLVAASAIERCTYRREIVNALFRRAPVSLPATAFGFRGAGVSYGGTGSSVLAGFRSDDGVRIELGDAGELPGFENSDGAPDPDLLVRLGRGDWIAYDVEIEHESVVEVVIVVDAGDAAPNVSLSGTDARVVRDDDRWCARSDGPLPAGRHQLRIAAGADGFALRRLDVVADDRCRP